MVLLSNQPRDLRIRFLLIITAARGLIIRDKPLPEGMGGKEIRRCTPGQQEYAFGIHFIQGVPYAHIVGANPNRPEWARVQEVDGSIKYVDIVRLDDGIDIDPLGESIRAAGNEIAEAISAVAKAITSRK